MEEQFVISCCSTVDMTLAWCREREVYPVSFHFALGADNYLDDFGQSLAPQEIYRRMLAGEDAKTSQVNVEEYEQHFRKFLQEGKDILHITLSSGISGTINSARIAAEDMEEEFPGRKVIIIDSLCASSGYGLLVDKICDLRDAGKSLEELRDWTEANKRLVQHWFFSTDLTFYIKGGRVSKTAGFIGNVLNICPLLDVDQNGTLQPREKVRTKKKVIERTLEKMTEYAQNGTDYDGKCFICQAECYDDARKLADLVEARFPKLNGKVMIYPIGATIGCHTSPGTIALFFFGKERV